MNGFLCNNFFLGKRIYIFSSRIGKTKSVGESTTVHFNYFSHIGKFLQIAADSIFRYIYLLAKRGRQYLIVYINLMQNICLSFPFKHSLEFDSGIKKQNPHENAKYLLKSCKKRDEIFKP